MPQILNISGNYGLVSFKGLENLKTIGWRFYCQSNGSLIDFQGLEGLRFIAKGMSVEENSSLKNFHGLENLEAIGDSSNSSFGLFIGANEALETLSGLDSVDLNALDLVGIYENPLLSFCNTPSICDYLVNGDSIRIFNNAPGCFEISEVQAVCAVPTSEVFSGKIKLSPNPTGDFLQIEISEKTAAPLAVEVFDAVGKLVLQKRLTSGQTLDLQGLPPGVFVLKAVAGERAYAGRFVKQ